MTCQQANARRSVDRFGILSDGAPQRRSQSAIEELGFDRYRWANQFRCTRISFPSSQVTTPCEKLMAMCGRTRLSMTHVCFMQTR